MTGWQVYRDGDASAIAIIDPGALSFDDTAVPAQGPHTYYGHAQLSGGPPRRSVSARFGHLRHDAAVARTTAGRRREPGRQRFASPGRPATDPTPGSGVADYIVRRGATTSAARRPDGRHRRSARCTAGRDRLRRHGRRRAARPTATRSSRSTARATSTPPGRDRACARHGASGPGDRLPRLGGPDHRAPALGLAGPRGQRLRSRGLPGHPPRGRPEAADEPARRHPGLPRPRLPRRRLLRAEPHARQEGHVRDLRDRRGAELLAADAADRDADGATRPSRIRRRRCASSASARASR